MPRPSPFAASGTLSGIDAAEFASRLLPALEAVDGVTVEIHGERPRYRELTGDPHVTVSTVESTDPDWFDLGVIVTIDGRSIPFAPLFTALSRGRAQAAPQRRTVLLARASVAAAAARPHRRGRRPRRVGDGPAHQPLPDGALGRLRGRRRRGRARRELAADRGGAPRRRSDPADAAAGGLHAQLRPYQRTGFEWLAFLWQHRLGGILADDMGLGKTLQMLALIAHAQRGRRDAAVPRRGADVGPVDLAQRGRAVRPRPAGRGRRRHARQARDRR